MRELKTIKESIDLEGVGEIEITWDFDEDEYPEWLIEAGYENNQESLMEYIQDTVTFDLEYFDNDTYHHMAFDTADYSDLVDSFGESMTIRIIKELQEKGESRFETQELYNNQEFDVNNPEELNKVSMQILNHGEYYKGCRGFILTNGAIVYTPAEHNMVSQIKGIKGTFDFIKRGNIRILNQSIDLAKEPTPEQRNVLRKVIVSYSDEELYVDILTNNGDVSAHYNHPDWRMVMGEIDRFFREGIRPQGRITESTEFGNNDLFTLAVNRFGTTRDIRECGYILPDGTMLDFSGSHQLKGDTSFLRGGRTVDHREIYILGWSEDGNTERFQISMSDFIRLGAIRTNVTGTYSYFTIFKKPTQGQISVLQRMIQYSKGCVDVEIGDGDESLSYGEYDEVKPFKVIADINRYFDEGIKLSGNINESIDNNVYLSGVCDNMNLIINGETVASYFFTDSTAYPFIIYEGKLYIGDCGETHSQLAVSCPVEIKDVNAGAYGRIWVKAKINEFNYAIVAFWGSDCPLENYKPYVYDVANKLKVNPNKIMVAVDYWCEIKMTPLSEWDGYIHKSTESEKEQRNLHMMNAGEKHNNTGDFRKTRDKKLGNKLTNDNGEEMPMAQYHNMIYQESKNILVTEEQYNRLFKTRKEIKINEDQYNRLFDVAK